MTQKICSGARNINPRAKVVEYVGKKLGNSLDEQRAVYVSISSNDEVEYVGLSEFSIGRSLHLLFGKKKDGSLQSRLTELNAKKVYLIFIEEVQQLEYDEMKIRLCRQLKPRVDNIQLN